jgi:hypothetical protein
MSQTESQRLRVEKAKAEAEGMCPSHPSISVKEGACPRCAERAAARTKKLLASGMCPTHPNNPTINGTKHCQKCVDDAAKRREKRKAEGMCATNGHADRPAINGTTRCQECFDEEKRKRQNAIDAGMCSRHHNRPAALGTVSCIECIDRMKQRAKAASAAGMCPSHPSIPVVPGLKYCQQCVDKYFLISSFFGCPNEHSVDWASYALSKHSYSQFGVAAALPMEREEPIKTATHQNSSRTPAHGIVELVKQVRCAKRLAVSLDETALLECFT